MRAKQIGMCRGNGCAFVKLALFDVPTSAPLHITAATDDGTILPICWRNANGDTDLPDSTRSIVIATPVFTAGSLSLFISSSPEIGHLDHPITITHDNLKWESRIAYRLRKDQAFDIRNLATTRSPFSDICLYFDRMIPDGGNVILRGSYQMPYHEDSDVRLSCFDFNGNALPIDPVWLSGSREQSPRVPTFYYRNQAFSLRLPGNAQSLVFFAIDNTHPDCTGFGVIDLCPDGAFFENSKKYWFNAAIDPSYDTWFRSRRISGEALEAQRRVRLNGAPSFSIVVALRDATSGFVQATIDSVKAQSYSDWELVLVDVASDDSDLLRIVTTAAESDARIRFTLPESDPGPTECLNLGIAASSGDFICLVDEGDAIEPDALFEYARFLAAKPETDMLYCDEDRAEPAESRFYEPQFKPGFDIDMLRSWNYIGHFACIRKSVLESIAPPTAEFDGAHAYNIILNAVENTGNIAHINRVLYHSRFGEGQMTAACRPRGKAETTAVLAHLKRLGISAAVHAESRKVHYAVQDNPLVSIVIPNKDCAGLLTECIRSVLEKTAYPHYEIVIVENNSEESATLECYKELKALDERVRVVTWPNEFNFSKIVNFGVECANGSYALLLNNDIEVIDSDWLENMLGLAQRQDVGAVGAKLLYVDKTVQHAGVAIIDDTCPCVHFLRYLPESNGGYFRNLDLTRQCSMVTGACLLTKVSTFNQVGGFDESLAVECNDIDFCLKLREAGYVIVCDPSTLYHYESVSRGLDSSIEKRARASKEHAYLRTRWARECVEGDPYANPNIDPCFYTLN